MTANLKIDSSPISAQGAFASRAFEPGETIHWMDGHFLSTWRIVAKIATLQVNFDDPLQIDDRTYLQLDEVSNRFNHSCAPNAAIRGARELFAIAPIAAGEEITFDYSLTVQPMLRARYWAMRCNCGAASCRGHIGDISTVPAGVRQAAIDRGGVQDHILHRLYRSPWNWTKFKPGPPPTLPGRDHSIFLKGGHTGVLLLHGLGGTPIEMGEVGASLAARGCTVLCPQLAGHCGTYADLKAVRWQDWAASAEAALRRLKATCDTVIIGGLSTGAVLSLNIAARFPDLVQGVALLAPTLWINGWAVPYHAYLFNIVLQKPIANMFDFPDLPPHGIKDEAIRRRVKAAMDSGDSSIAGVPVTPGGAVIEHRWMVKATLADLKWIKQPVLMVHPREDEIADLNNIAHVIRHVRGPVETITLDDSYHIVTVDRQREELKHRLGAFVARLAARHTRESGGVADFGEAFASRISAQQ